MIFLNAFFCFTSQKLCNNPLVTSFLRKLFLVLKTLTFLLFISDSEDTQYSDYNRYEYIPLVKRSADDDINLKKSGATKKPTITSKSDSIQKPTSSKAAGKLVPQDRASLQISSNRSEASYEYDDESGDIPSNANQTVIHRLMFSDFFL